MLNEESYKEQFMMDEKLTVEEFSRRTGEILKQYSNLTNINHAEFYDVTLLVNCMYGLLSMPEQKHFDKLSDAHALNYLRKNEISNIDISVYNTGSPNQVEQPPEITFQELIKGLRNGLAHWGKPGDNNAHKDKDKYDGTDNVSYIKGNSRQVEKLCIKGTIKGFKKTVEVTFDLTQEKNPVLALVELIGMKNSTRSIS
jgi:hypothetical protein